EGLVVAAFPHIVGAVMHGDVDQDAGVAAHVQEADPPDEFTAPAGGFPQHHDLVPAAFQVVEEPLPVGAWFGREPGRGPVVVGVDRLFRPAPAVLVAGSDVGVFLFADGAAV